MPHVLELKDGECFTPLGIYDVMDVIDEKLGADVRQYLEDYIEGDEEEEPLTMDEYFIEVLDNLDYKVRQIEIAVNGKRTDKKAIQACVEAMRQMIEREKNRGNG